MSPMQHILRRFLFISHCEDASILEEWLVDIHRVQTSVALFQSKGTIALTVELHTQDVHCIEINSNGEGNNRIRRRDRNIR